MIATDILNKAITKYVRNNGYMNRTGIEREFGKDVLTEVINMAAFGVNDVIWAGLDQISAYNETTQKTKNKYQFLTDKSAKKLAAVSLHFWEHGN